ncbi:glycosyl hydrolase family 61-domain-containing protein [Lineolata rhizophorae]|uniref:AA9 family lytic polysaccharide monooxygenase n=1 Tax=Lineolata rhizophorae TaxID=578093 RepID=A0A6A6P4K6_9PEZI|nr:glycosyl hydrolase family 61-domain-containing protein [Lineolata rhizophorae]
MFYKTQSVFLAALAGAQAVNAHTTFTTFFLDGVSQGDGTCVRMNNNAEEATFPVFPTDDAMACGFNGQNGVDRVCNAEAGQIMTFEYRAHPDDPTQEALDRGHRGPCAVYMKRVESAIDDNAVGDGWFKIWESGYDESSDQWCTDRLIDNDGHISVELPSALEQGYYLVRPEVLALHAAADGDPQYYTGCAQVFLQSEGDVVVSDTVSIPGYVSLEDPGVSFNLWKYPTFDTPYPIPGPPVTDFSAVAKKKRALPSSSSRAAAAGSLARRAAVLRQTEGQKPAGCVVQNANWCGIEIEHYSGSEQGCWDASEQCWSQADECWDSAPPSGYTGCEIWQEKCEGIQAQCEAGNFEGPPNEGEDLNPAPRTLGDVGVSPSYGSDGETTTPGDQSGESDDDDEDTSSSSTPSSTSSDDGDSDDDEDDSSSSAAPLPTSSATTPKPTDTEAEEDDYDDYDTGSTDSPAAPVASSASSPAASPSSAAPAVTPAPDPHVVYETVYETVWRTEVQYVTMYDYGKRDAHAHAKAHAVRKGL